MPPPYFQTPKKVSNWWDLYFNILGRANLLTKDHWSSKSVQKVVIWIPKKVHNNIPPKGPCHLKVYAISYYWSAWCFKELLDFVEGVWKFYISDLDQKKIVPFFVNGVFSSHKCDSSNHILVFIHVEKTLWALPCKRCGRYFKIKWE